MERRKRNKNKSLYWYGVMGNLKQLLGILVITIFIIFAMVTQSWIIFLIGLFIGGYLFLTGKSQRFDYKMRSGSLIHRGDW